MPFLFSFGGPPFLGVPRVKDRKVHLLDQLVIIFVSGWRMFTPGTERFCYMQNMPKFFWVSILVELEKIFVDLPDWATYFLGIASWAHYVVWKLVHGSISSARRLQPRSVEIAFIQLYRFYQPIDGEPTGLR